MNQSEPDLHPLSEEFSKLQKLCACDRLTVGELALELERRGPALIALLLGFPFLLPSLPGVATPFGVLIAFAGIGVTFGKKAPVPGFIRGRQVPARALHKAFGWGRKAAQVIEPLLRPRLLWLSTEPKVQPIHGLLIALAGVMLALPLPPGTNFLPAAVIVLTSLGVLERDGAAILLGYLAFALMIAQFVVMYFLGLRGVNALLELG